MKTKKIFLLMLFLGSGVLSSFNQEQITFNKKLYEVWLSTRTEPGRLEGILFEVKDSSILISDSRIRDQYLSGKFNVTEIDFKNLDHLIIRSQNSRKKGAWIGGGISAVLSIITIHYTFRAIPFARNVFLILGVPTMSIAGAGIGSFFGSIPVRYSIQGSYENFDWYRSKMQSRSLVPGHVKLPYEHKNFFGWLIGPSFPVGDFAGKSPDSNNSGFAKSGYSSDFNFSLKVSPKLTISFSAFYNQYDLQEGNDDYYWLVGGAAIGPMFEIPVTDKFFIDLKPRIGILEAQLLTEEFLEKLGSGFAINPGASFKYNIARRWVLIAKAEYIYSNPKELDLNSLQTFNLGFGAGYRIR